MCLLTIRGRYHDQLADATSGDRGEPQPQPGLAARQLLVVYKGTYLPEPACLIGAARTPPLISITRRLFDRR